LDVDEPRQRHRKVRQWPGQQPFVAKQLWVLRDVEPQGPAHFHYRLRAEAGLEVAMQFDFGDVPKIQGHFPRRSADHSPGGRSGCPCSTRSEEHTSELQSRENLVCRL